MQSLRGVKVPLGADSASPSAYLWCREVTLERRQWGAFRIGVLPQPVLSGVKLRLLPQAKGSTWAADLHRLLTEDKSLHGFLMREFAMENAEGRVILEARKAAPGVGNEHIELSEVFLHGAFDRPKPIRSSQALLWLAGPKAGSLQLTRDTLEFIRIAP